MTEPSPTPGTGEPHNQKRQRRTLLMVVAVAALPAIIAAVLVVFDWRPSGRSLARGELLQPVRMLPRQEWKAIGDTSNESRPGQGKWLLLTVADAHCDEACERTLFSMQQARLLTNSEMRRVERVLLTQSLSAGERKQLGEKFPGLNVYEEKASASTVLKKLLLEDGRDPHAWIFLIDPMGNLVLRYAPGADTAGLYKDLGRLLRLSQIG